MDERYTVIDDELHNRESKLYNPIRTFTLKDDNNTYTCIMEYNINKVLEKITYVSDNINRFDMAKTLFEYDMDTYNALPGYLVSNEMDDVWGRYFVGCGNKSIYKNDDEYYEAYKEEEKRIKDVKKYVKK